MGKVKRVVCPIQGKGSALSLPWHPSSWWSSSCVLKEAIWSTCEIGLQDAAFPLSTQPGKPDRVMPQTPSLNPAGSQLRIAKDRDSCSQSNYTTHNSSWLWVTLPLSPGALMSPPLGLVTLLSCMSSPLTPLSVCTGTITFPPVFSCAVHCAWCCGRPQWSSGQ